VPWAANSVSNLPILLRRRDCGDSTDNLVPWNDGTAGGQHIFGQWRGEALQWDPKGRLLGHDLGMADTASQHLNQHLPLLGHLCLNLFEDEGSAFLLEHGRLVGLGDLGRHSECWFDEGKLVAVCGMNFKEVSSVNVVVSECGPRIYIDRIWWAFSNHGWKWG